MDPQRNLLDFLLTPPQRQPPLPRAARSRSIASSDIANLQEERVVMNQGFLGQLPNGYRTPLARPPIDRNPRGYVRRLNNDEAGNLRRRATPAAPRRPPSLQLGNDEDEIDFSFVAIRSDRIQAARIRSGLNHIQQNVRGNDLVRLQLPHAMVDNFILLAMAYNQAAGRTQNQEDRNEREDFPAEEGPLNYEIDNAPADQRDTTPVNDRRRYTDRDYSGFQANQRRDNHIESERSVSPVVSTESPAFFDNEGILRSSTDNSMKRRRRDDE